MTTSATQSQADPRGSVWRRWDPHIHTPGTAMNNQFGQDAWDDYLTRIEQSEPRIDALGITVCRAKTSVFSLLPSRTGYGGA